MQVKLLTEVEAAHAVSRSMTCSAHIGESPTAGRSIQTAKASHVCIGATGQSLPNFIGIPLYVLKDWRGVGTHPMTHVAVVIGGVITLWARAHQYRYAGQTEAPVLIPFTSLSRHRASMTRGSSSNTSSEPSILGVCSMCIIEMRIYESCMTREEYEP